jgi:CRP-like cAMP-binding protein
VEGAESWVRLRQVPLFAPLPDDGLRQLWRASVPRRYDRGEVLRVQGDPAEHLMVLLDGRTAASATTSGGRVVRFGAWNGPCALDKVALLDGQAIRRRSPP